MSNKATDPRVRKALEQLQIALKHPALSTHFDPEARDILMLHSELLKGGSWPWDEAFSRLETAVTSLEGVAKNVEHSAVAGAKKAVVEAVGDVKGVIDFVETVKSHAEEGAKSVVYRVASEVAENVLKPLEPKIAEIAKMVFAKLPYHQLITMMLQQAEDYEKRLEYVLNSLYKLEQAVTGKTLENCPFQLKFRTIENDLDSIGRWFFDHSTFGIFLSLLREPTLENVLNKLIPLPPKVEANFLHVWLTEDSIDDEEREFRKQLVACVDQFVRDYRQGGQLAIPTSSGAKTTENLLSDFFSLLFSCIGGFAFRHPNVSSPTLPKLYWASQYRPPRRPFDGAHVVSTGVSRSVSYVIKGAVGTIGRGIWEINAHNDALIEGVASGIASLVGALIQSLMHDLFSVLEIREVYNDEVNDKLLNWPSVPDRKSEPVTSCWCVTIRTQIIPKAWADNLLAVIKSKEPELVGLLQSYTAYMDAIRHYTDSLDVGDDERISIDSFDKLSSKLTITYECTSGDLERRPVIRAYCNGDAKVMTPDAIGPRKTRSYTCVLDNVPPGNVMAYVRSNWGGSVGELIRSLKPQGTT